MDPIDALAMAAGVKEVNARTWPRLLAEAWAMLAHFEDLPEVDEAARRDMIVWL